MSSPTVTGRPRDASIDADALQAARLLLEEVGFEGTTMQAIAARADVHASALYRRWPSRIELIEDAVTPTLAVVAKPPSGDLATDLRRLIRAYLSAWTSPASQAAISGLLAHYQSDGSRRSPEEWFSVSVRPQFFDILRSAPTEQVDSTLDPDDVFDVLLGALLARVLVPTVIDRHRPVERLVELTLRMLQPMKPVVNVEVTQ